MHKLMSKPITGESFEMDDYNKDLIVTMYNENGLRDWYLNGFVDYLIEQLELNPRLLAWLFDDNYLIGKSYLVLDSGRYEAFQDFYNSLSIYDD